LWDFCCSSSLFLLFSFSFFFDSLFVCLSLFWNSSKKQKELLER